MIRFIQIGFAVILMTFLSSCGSDTAVVSDTEWELVWNEEFHKKESTILFSRKNIKSTMCVFTNWPKTDTNPIRNEKKRNRVPDRY